MFIVGFLPGSVQRERASSLLTTYWSESTIIVMIRWTGLAPWEFEFPFPGSLASTFLRFGAHDLFLDPAQTQSRWGCRQCSCVGSNQGLSMSRACSPMIDEMNE